MTGISQRKNHIYFYLSVVCRLASVCIYSLCWALNICVLCAKISGFAHFIMSVAAFSRRCSLFFMVCFEMYVLVLCHLWKSHAHFCLNESKLFIYAIRYDIEYICRFCKIVKDKRLKVNKLVFQWSVVCILATPKWLKQFSSNLSRRFLSFMSWTDTGKTISSLSDELPLLWISLYSKLIKPFLFAEM